MQLRAPDQGLGPAGRAGPGAVRPVDRRDHRVLYIGQFLSKQRTAQALAEMFGIPLSSGTVAGITARDSAGRRRAHRRAESLIMPGTCPGRGSVCRLRRSMS